MTSSLCVLVGQWQSLLAMSRNRGHDFFMKMCAQADGRTATVALQKQLCSTPAVYDQHELGTSVQPQYKKYLA